MAPMCQRRRLLSPGSVVVVAVLVFFILVALTIFSPGIVLFVITAGSRMTGEYVSASDVLCITMLYVYTAHCSSFADAARPKQWSPGTRFLCIVILRYGCFL